MLIFSKVFFTLFCIPVRAVLSADENFLNGYLYLLNV